MAGPMWVSPQACIYKGLDAKLLVCYLYIFSLCKHLSVML